ncbi:MAG: pyridoxamine 5'-phosphate oxidase family protein [Candidatus Rokubacteria bacterium]|nr:pyridoxamine 5'-phosphate oxidase family protein [Candidatus Rokubacteria bacterium]
MARDLGDALPEELRALLGAGELADREGKALTLLTVDPEGWPHPALLSYGEVVALGARDIAVATYRESRTSGHMRRTGRLTLCLVDAGMAYYLKGEVREVENPMAGFPGLARFAVTVRAVLVDQAREDVEPEARLTGGITFEVGRDREASVPYWNRLRKALAERGVAVSPR